MRKNDFFKYILLNGGSQSGKAELESETLPYLYQSNGGRLRNYRIYGDTVNHTNLFAGVEFTDNAYISANGSEMYSGGTLALKHSDFISISENTSYTLKFTAITLQTPNSNTISFCFFDENKEILSYRPTKSISSGDAVEWSNISPENAKYLIINTVSASDTLNLYATYESTGVGDYDSESDKYIIPVIIQNKNILQNQSPSRTFGNLTAVVQEDGTVILNGTSPSTAFIDINTKVFVESGMILSGCPSGGSNNTYCLRVTKLSDNNYATQKGDDIVFTSSENYKISIRINANYTCDNLIFRPMIRYPNTDGVFVAYEEPAIKNISLDSPLDEDEYVDFREQKRFNSDDTSEIVSLPAITSINGISVLSVNTAVQPEKIYVQGNVQQPSVSLQMSMSGLRSSQNLNFMKFENDVGGGELAR